MKYKIFEGNDFWNNKKLYQVIGINNDYIGEWHCDKKEAEKELNYLMTKK